MQTVHKYPFEVTDEFTQYMPPGARILAVELQSGTPCMWALGTPGKALVERHFRVFGTGHPIEEGDDESLSFVATFQAPPAVWHVFEVTTR